MTPSIFSAILIPRSLQQRFLIFLLLPVFLIIVFLGTGQFFIVREMVVSQWGDTTVSKLQRAAHAIDMELNQPRQILRLLDEKTDKESQCIRDFILERLRGMRGVTSVEIDWQQKTRHASGPDDTSNNPSTSTHDHSELRGNEKYSPYTYSAQNRSVILRSELEDSQGGGTSELIVRFSLEDLVAPTKNMPWWRSYRAYIVDMQGNILADASSRGETLKQSSSMNFRNLGKLEAMTLAAMQGEIAGTVFGPGMPPEEISGYYRLEEAPWVLVLIAPGREALEPVIRFNIFFVSLTLLGFLLIIIVIRLLTSRITLAIKGVSQAAEDLSRGTFGEPLPVTSEDEVGELTRSFNMMRSQLRHGMHLQQAMEVARTVQQTFLPSSSISYPGLSVAGLSVFCDETGGDFFDYIKFPGNPKLLGIMVGDVVGHGIGAALMMATVRALVRGRMNQSGSLAEKMNDINYIFCADTIQTGNFASLFLLIVDLERQQLEWVRAGHDPAILYSPNKQLFTELKGEGLVLGVDPVYSYQSSVLPLDDEDVLVLIGSDGVWEVEDTQGQQFGKERLRNLIKQEQFLRPTRVLQHIIDEVTRFRGPRPQADDITLVALRINRVGRE